MTAGAKDVIANKWKTLTLGLRASKADEDNNNVLSWKKFDAKSAVLSTTYNTVPNAPNSLDTIPSSGGCDMVAPYTTIGNTDVTLTAKVSDPDGGTVRAEFRLWGTNNLAGGAEIFNQIVSATSGTVAKVKVPKATLQKHLAAAKGNFGWKVQTLDASANSAWNPSAQHLPIRLRPHPAQHTTHRQLRSSSPTAPTAGPPSPARPVPPERSSSATGASMMSSPTSTGAIAPIVRNVTPSADLDGDGRSTPSSS
ncbi:Repeat domain-containing protein OS=Streptomyces microflavus OX=1919 GN=Smic_45650 PE=4 SV=1 [Streptomyces microflavus]